MPVIHARDMPVIDLPSRHDGGDEWWNMHDDATDATGARDATDATDAKDKKDAVDANNGRDTTDSKDAKDINHPKNTKDKENKTLDFRSLGTQKAPIEKAELREDETA